MKQKPGLTHEQKHSAFLGFRKGVRKVKAHVTLAAIKCSGTELCFTVYANTDTGVNHIHVPRLLVNGRWLDASARPHLAGEEAGEVAASWWTRNGRVSSNEEAAAPIEIDPDFVKWVS